MRLQELFDTESFIDRLTKARSAYPANSISKRESVYKLPVDDPKKAEQICSALNADVTAAILKFHEKMSKGT